MRDGRRGEWGQTANTSISQLQDSIWACPQQQMTSLRKCPQALVVESVSFPLACAERLREGAGGTPAADPRLQPRASPSPRKLSFDPVQEAAGGPGGEKESEKCSSSVKRLAVWGAEWKTVNFNPMGNSSFPRRSS